MRNYRNSEIEFKRFINIAAGSIFEVETQIIICLELGYVRKSDSEKLQELLTQYAKMIHSLINKIKNS